MKTQKQFLGFILILSILITFTQCSSAQKLQEQASFELGEVSFQRWIAGVQGGGSGYHMLINVISNKNNVVFDSVYFRGYKAKIEIGKIAYVANIKTKDNQREDLIMSNNGQEEFGNKQPNKEANSSFKLSDKECVISYIENETTKYLKVNNLIEKPKEEYPSAPPREP
ncbi:hypothetical protein [Xanthomarina sp. F2636L]|uniref:hypothetical protein n=1 Tax=Xanthomarina sp. F2636L TaxID=2996018 RepID=UPI00225E463C|nr:hypothetical protein [Xanthomarina sp. F2636L]MCX7551364.1 hypothetical protein [Xanthomarina sp. F2636L]